jgi:transposase
LSICSLRRTNLPIIYPEFRLDYKLATLPAGVPVIFIDPKHTSQRCNQCGYTEKANRRSRDLFVCRACGHSENANENGSKNIRLKGLEVLGSADVIPPNAEAISCAQ